MVKDFSLNDPEYLNEKDIKEISDLGHTIAVHGKDHNWWTLKTNKQLIAELKETQNWIEGITRKKVITCAAPGGVLNKRIIECIHQNIPEFKYIRTVKVGINEDENSLIRIAPIHTSTGIYKFRYIITGNAIYFFLLRIIYYIKKIMRPLFRYIYR